MAVIFYSKHFNAHQRLIVGKEMATHSSTLAWKIPWTEKPSRLQSMGSLEYSHWWYFINNWISNFIYILHMIWFFKRFPGFFASSPLLNMHANKNHTQVHNSIYSVTSHLPDAKNWVIGKDPDAGKDWRQQEKDDRGWDGVWYHRLYEHKIEQALGVGEGQGSLACCRLWGCKE